MNYVLPGMGATSAMYAREWQAFEGFLFLDWPSGFAGESIEDLARLLVSNHLIARDDLVIGSSFGGMVACEIANQRDMPGVVLIGSATHKEEVSKILSLLNPIIDLAPVGFVQRAAALVPGELARMFRQSDPRFIRNMCRAIFKWGGVNDGRRVFRIHGAYDRIIPKPLSADLVIDGGHLIAMTHASACISAITNYQLERESQSRVVSSDKRLRLNE